jgi:phosphomannomutase
MDLIALANNWLAQDPDPLTRLELEKLIEAGDQSGLESRFSARLQFGTAGLRGELGAGPNRMNRIVVAQAAFAIARFLKANRNDYLDKNGELSVVVGYDGRVNSDIFAQDSAEIFAGAGIRTRLFDSAVPTPVAAFTGKRFHASATVIVTASHNPPRDNGYKVYLGGQNGCSQLISPQDKQIAALIDEIALDTKFADIPKASNIETLGQADIDAYVKRAASLVASDTSGRNNLKITYTAMHGVGYRVMKAVFDSTGFVFSSVAKQQEPDGQFPTVAFPNPEEPGAMDLSFAHALTQHSDLIIANDPDADRLAVGVRSGNGYQMLTGDQVGLLLAEMIASAKQSGTLANSIVSASLAKVAAFHNLKYQQTLTGFKWISKVPNLSFGYEEALGYCIDPTFTPDKDGISAALAIAELAATLKAEGMDLLDLLRGLAKRYGHLATGQVSIRVTDLSVISKIMNDVKSNPVSQILGQDAEFENLELGNNLPATEGVIFTTSSYRVIIRPSGTEPKLKCYLQVTADSEDASKAMLAELKEWAQQLLSGY